MIAWADFDSNSLFLSACRASERAVGERDGAKQGRKEWKKRGRKKKRARKSEIEKKGVSKKTENGINDNY